MVAILFSPTDYFTFLFVLVLYLIKNNEKNNEKINKIYVFSVAASDYMSIGSSKYRG